MSLFFAWCAFSGLAMTVDTNDGLRCVRLRSAYITVRSMYGVLCSDGVKNEARGAEMYG